jgi:hypothetical protein
MEPVISPAWFYLAYVFNTIHLLSLIILPISLLTMAVSPFITYCVCENCEEEDCEKGKKLTRKVIKICAVAAALCIILLVFIPNEKTIYAMIAASMITPDNISITEDHITELISKIAEAVKNQ